MLSSMIKIKDIYQCEDTDHVYAIVRKVPWATHMVRMSDLVPAGARHHVHDPWFMFSTLSY